MTIQTYPENLVLKRVSEGKEQYSLTDAGKSWFTKLIQRVNEGEPPSDETEIVASIGIQVSSSHIRIISSTSGDTTITADPQITGGRYDGQLLKLEGTDDVKTVTLNNGNGVQLKNSTTTYKFGQGDILSLHYNAIRKLWIEDARSKNSAV